MRATSLGPVVPLVGLVAFVGLGACLPSKPPPPAPPPPPKLGAIERPEDVLGEVLVRDPLALVDQLLQTPGAKGADPLAALKAPELAPVAEVVDLHGCVAVALFGEPKAPDTWHGGAAFRVKDPKGARAKFAEAAAKGSFTVVDDANIRAKIFTFGKAHFALIGEALVVADSDALVERDGRWLAKETEGTPTHEVSLHVPLARFARQLEGEAKSWVDKEVARDVEVASWEPLARSIVGFLGDLGDVSLSVDLEKQDAVVDLKLGASGGLSDWLAKYPSSSSRSLLTLPRGAGAAVVRFPQALSDTVKAALDGAGKAKPSKEADDVRALARALGTEVAFVYGQKAKKAGEGGKLNELLVRLELVDPAGAKAAVRALVVDLAGKPDRKVTRGPWARFGADGESITVARPGERFEARWAIKGNALYVDVCDDGKVTLLDAALDPNAKGLLGQDVRAKSFVDKLPKDGLAFAFYSQSAAAPKAEELGAVPALDGIRWGWVSADKAGVASMWNVPLIDFADTAGKVKL